MKPTKARNDDFIEADFYVCGVYRGKMKVGKHSICGAYLSGDMSGMLKGLQSMEKEINQLPGVKAKISVSANKVTP